MKFNFSLIVCLVAMPILAPLQTTNAMPQPQKSETKAEDKAPQFDVEQYPFGLLKRGPKWTPESTPETQKIQAGHMANINKMARMGKLMAAGPMGDNGELRGIFHFQGCFPGRSKSVSRRRPGD